MAWIDGEPKPLSRRSVQTPEEIVGHVQYGATLLADEMAVRAVREVVGRRTMPDVRVHDDAETLQLLEVAIDRREVHVRHLRLHRSGQILRGGMVRRLEEDFQEEPAGGRGSAPLLPHQGQDGVDRTQVGCGNLEVRGIPHPNQRIATKNLLQ